MIRNRDGFALPMAVLLIGFMTAGVVAAFARIETEGRTVDDQASEIEALAIAQDGLERAIASGQTTPATQTMTLSGGTATVRKILLRPGNTARDTSVWLFRSTGRTSARPARQPATRDVAQIVYRAGGSMQVLSSWTSLSGLIKNGASGDISGADECGGMPTLAGVAVPTGEFSGHDDAISGSPAISEMGTQSQMANQIKIDWVNIAKPQAPAIQPDYIRCVSGSYGYESQWSPCNGWPASSLFTNPDFWPVIVINGSSALPSNGRGTLIVTGDLTLGGGDNWDGIILVGGKLTDNGSGDVSGAVVTGLNVKKGMPVGQSSKANGTKDYSYNSCEVASAASKFMKVNPIRNAWMDNWPSW